MSLPAAIQKMHFMDFLAEQFPRLGTEDWVTVYESSDTASESFGIFCALFPIPMVERCLEAPSWEESIGFGMPGETVYYDNGAQQRRYHRFGSDDGIEPLVMARNFHGARPRFMELSEEFRHFFNLYEENGVFFAVDDAGDEEEAARMDEHRIEIRLRYLKNFLATKQMALALFFDIDRWSELPPQDLGLDGNEQTVRTSTSIYKIYGDEWPGTSSDGRRSWARCLGKIIISGTDAPVPSKTFLDFIVGTNTNGEPITHTCAPEKLANYFGANPGAPHYLTPVFFRREVLDKYYASATKYTVSDGHLYCASLWGLRLDNNHPKYVIVFLGDLGRDLPTRERLYWKSFNVPPDGGMSEVNIRRSMLGEFTSPSMKDLLFKEQFEIFQRDWHRQYGWYLFKPLAEGDKHFWTSLRIPLKNEQAQFDEQVLALAKILIDSINEAQLKLLIPTQPSDTRSIKKLQIFLEQKGANEATEIVFLKNLWSLRHGTPHRKGDEYQRAATAFKTKQLGFVDAFASILDQTIGFLAYLRVHLLAGTAASETDAPAANTDVLQ